MKALVADASMIMRKVLIGALSQAGIRDITEVGDGTEAVLAVMAEHFDIVLLDWHMPKMLGIEALRKIRAEGYNMPIIMVTTEADKANVIAAIKAGANDFVVKPVRPETITAKIRKSLEESSR